MVNRNDSHWAERNCPLDFTALVALAGSKVTVHGKTLKVNTATPRLPDLADLAPE